MRFSRLLGLACVFGGVLSNAFPEPMPEAGMPGETMAAGWENLGSAAISASHVDREPWPSGIPAQSGQARMEYHKVRGSGYPIAAGIYSGGADYHGPLREKILSGEVTPGDLPRLKAEDFSHAGAFRIVANTPLKGMKTVVFLVRLQGLPRGKHFTPFELTQQAFPVTLDYNGGSQKLPATRRKLVSIGLRGGFPEEIHAFQWDLSGVGEVTAFSIGWTVYPHSCTTGLRVEQGAAASASIFER